MPSQEDYLDELLKTMDEDSEKGEAPEGEQEIPDIDTLSELTEDEILQLLAENGDTEPDEDMLSPQPEELDIFSAADSDITESIGTAEPDEDMLSPQPEELDIFSEADGAEDENLREIRELLQKADRNEPIVEEEEEELTDGLPDELSGLLAGQAAETTAKTAAEAEQEKAKQPENIREEKLKRRENARKERAEKREAARSERAKKREAAKRAREEKREKARAEKADKKFDKSSLDAIVAEAGELGEADDLSVLNGLESADDLGGLNSLGGIDDLGGLNGLEGADDLGGLNGLEGADDLGGLNGLEGAGDLGGLNGLEGAGDLGGLNGLEGADDLGGLNGLGGIDDLGGLNGLEEADDLVGETTDAAAGTLDSDFDLDHLFQNGEESELSELMGAGTGTVEAAGKVADTKQKKGLFRKIVEFLTEEEEEEGTEEIRLSEENREILRDLDKEGKADKKRKKSKKASKKNAEGEEGSSKTAKRAKTQKAAKENKPKREKKAKKEKEIDGEGLVSLIPEKRLSPKRVLPVLLVGVSVGVLLFVFANASADYTDKKEAREAFYDGDYRTCYQNLYGKELNESEKVMYAKSESILYIRLWLREYEMFADEGDELRALDSLIQTVDDYPMLYAYAVQWNAGGEVEEGYAQILSILLDKYGLTEEQAQQIADVPKDKEYTRLVTAVVQGNGLGMTGEPGAESGVAAEGGGIPGAEALKDELPEETELGQETFVEP